MDMALVILIIQIIIMVLQAVLAYFQNQTTEEAKAVLARLDELSNKLM